MIRIADDASFEKANVLPLDMEEYVSGFPADAQQAFHREIAAPVNEARRSMRTMFELSEEGRESVHKLKHEVVPAARKADEKSQHEKELHDAEEQFNTQL